MRFGQKAWKRVQRNMLRDAKVFRNYTKGEFEAECAEYRQMGQSPHKAWFIKIGFAGFNSVANNWNGYVSKASAEAACLRYQYKGERTSLDRET